MFDNQAQVRQSSSSQLSCASRFFSLEVGETVWHSFGRNKSVVPLAAQLLGPPGLQAAVRAAFGDQRMPLAVVSEAVKLWNVLQSAKENYTALGGPAATRHLDSVIEHFLRCHPALLFGVGISSLRALIGASIGGPGGASLPAAAGVATRHWESALFGNHVATSDGDGGADTVAMSQVRCTRQAPRRSATSHQ
jgi:hypothetical protein